MRFSKILNSSAILAGCILSAIAASAAIDLTPEVSDYTAEGLKFQQLTFGDNKKRIEYEPPHGWTFDGGSSELHLRPPKKNYAEAVIQTATLSKPHALDENVRNSLKERVLVSVPGGSQLVKLERETESPILLSGNPTFEIIVSYHLMGEKFFRSTLFSNVGDIQMTFRCSARKDDFERVYQEFRISLLSWHWIDPETQATRSVSSNASSTSAQ